MILNVLQQGFSLGKSWCFSNSQISPNRTHGKIRPGRTACLQKFLIQKSVIYEVPKIKLLKMYFIVNFVGSLFLVQLEWFLRSKFGCSSPRSGWVLLSIWLHLKCCRHSKCNLGYFSLLNFFQIILNLLISYIYLNLNKIISWVCIMNVLQVAGLSCAIFLSLIVMKTANPIADYC